MVKWLVFVVYSIFLIIFAEPFFLGFFLQEYVVFDAEIVFFKLFLNVAEDVLLLSFLDIENVFWSKQLLG